MLPNKFEMPLDLVVKPSRIFLLYLYCIFLFSIVSVFISSLLLAAKFLLAAVLFIFIIFEINKKKLNKITKISLSGEDKWEVESNNKLFEVELQGECIVTSFLIWLNFKTCSRFDGKKNFHVLLLPDSAEKDRLRQLRVRLRFLKGSSEEEMQI